MTKPNCLIHFYMRGWYSNSKSNSNSRKNEDDLRNEDDLKNEDNLKKDDDLKFEDDLKNEDNLKIEDNLNPKQLGFEKLKAFKVCWTLLPLLNFVWFC